MCGCPAGVADGRCNHLSATLFALEDEFRMENSVNSEEESPRVATSFPCTSQPCLWNIPNRKQKIEPQPIKSINFEKHEYGKEIKYRMGEFQ